MGLAPRHPTCWPLGTGALPGGARAPSRKAAHKKTTTDPALFPIGSELFQGQAGRGVLSRPGRPDPAPAQSSQQPRVWHKDPRAQVAAGWGGGLHHQLKRQRGTRSRGHTQTRGNTWTRGAHPDTRGHAQTQGGAPGQGETPGHKGTRPGTRGHTWGQGGGPGDKGAHPDKGKHPDKGARPDTRENTWTQGGALARGARSGGLRYASGRGWGGCAGEGSRAWQSASSSCSPGLWAGVTEPWGRHSFCLALHTLGGRQSRPASQPIWPGAKAPGIPPSCGAELGAPGRSCSQVTCDA